MKKRLTLLTLVGLLGLFASGVASAQHIPETEIKCDAHMSSKIDGHRLSETKTFTGRVNPNPHGLKSFIVEETLMVPAGYKLPITFDLSITITPRMFISVRAEDQSDGLRLIESAGYIQSTGFFYTGVDLKTDDSRIQIICRTETII